VVTDWRSERVPLLPVCRPSGGWSAAVSCWPSKGDRRWPSPQPSPSRTTKTSGRLRPSKGGPVTDVGDAAWLCELLRVWAAARQLRASTGNPPAARPCPLPQAARSRPMAPSASASRRPWRTPASSRVSVATDVLGVSGRAMLEALVAGERDPRRWRSWPGASCARSSPNCARRCAAASASIMGCWSVWPLTTRGHLEGAIAALDGRIDEVIAPFAVATDRLGDHHRGRQARRRGHHRRHAAST
jgi:hypothetical protein